MRVRRSISLACGAAILMMAAALGQQPVPSPDPPSPPPSGLSYADAFILGLVEGITEYLPVSSTGHLILAGEFLHLNRDEPLLDRAGRPVTDRSGDTLTLKQAVDAYIVIIQAGAIAAVAILYRRRLLSVLAGLRGRDPAGLRLLRNLLVAFLPAAATGLLLGNAIDRLLFHYLPVAGALIVGGIAMILVEFWRRRRCIAAGSPGRDIDALTVRQSLTIGLLQCLALWPGMSRSMTTIVGGYLVGLRPVYAAEFSFLLGFVTLTAASGYRALGLGLAPLTALGWGPVLVGALVAGFSAAVAVRWLVRFLSRRGLTPFGYYRIALAIVVVAWFART